MANSPRARKKREATPADGLIRALDFVGVASRDQGIPYQQHVLLRDHWAIAFDGILAAGHYIKDDMNACPHTGTLKKALTKCGESLTITLLDNQRLSINSGRFNAKVPCIGVEQLYFVAPDPPIAPLTNELRTALAAVMHLATDGAISVAFASIHIQPSVVTATNGKVIAQYWHGIDFPPGLIIPKAAAVAIAKTDKKLVSFGYTSSSMTLYYEDNSWIKTQLFIDKWPNVDEIISRISPNMQTKPLPEGFWEGIEAVAPFAESLVYFKPGKIQSHENPIEGASYDVFQMCEGGSIYIKDLIGMRHMIETVDFQSSETAVIFQGERTRGFLVKAKKA